MGYGRVAEDICFLDFGWFASVLSIVMSFCILCVCYVLGCFYVLWLHSMLGLFFAVFNVCWRLSAWMPNIFVAFVMLKASVFFVLPFSFFPASSRCLVRR